MENEDNSRKSILDEVIQSQEESSIRDFNPYEAVLLALRTLDERESDILKRRYDLEGNGAMTLEEIGKLYNVTRERVRQIESASLKELKKKYKRIRSFENAARTISSVLHSRGKIAEEELLLKSLLEEKGDSDVDKNAILFVLDLAEDFDLHEDNEYTKKAWSLKGQDIKVPSRVIDVFLSVLDSRGEPIHYEKVNPVMEGHEEHGEFIRQIEDDIVLSYLELSKKIKKNPFGEWGLANWRNVMPKGIRDKAFLVVKKHAKPVHFRDIAKLIDKAKFDYKKAHPQTVHNELIKDERFVLVGRGIYGLKEWGHTPGTVADVIHRILEKKGAPMSQDEIVKRVLDKRMVKKNTVVLGLQDKQRFRKLDNGDYGLI